jgi:ABC-type bacteriocin/lantibiotic exporter with double-glycine peptidase domain
MILADHEINCTPSEITASMATGSGEVSMLDLKRFAEKKGLSVSGWRLTFDDLRSAPKPVILLVSGGHFIVADSVDARGRVICRDPESGNILYPRDALASSWHGEALVFGPMKR